ncbi:hypothetical protein [Bifidobacterium platyrrhinorum]|uniref:hypothetical protein n=1 Tax=Bifidobacterium platyrrhinorum TaxID=2661628 RepID=UPI0013D0B9C5|nr:hypothetical protein [Bifidobacterium platyrrhinorum]
MANEIFNEKRRCFSIEIEIFNLKWYIQLNEITEDCRPAMRRVCGEIAIIQVLMTIR